MTNNNTNATTRTVDRAFDVLECFNRKQVELSLVEISEAAGLSPSTAHRIIGTLENRGYLERNPDNKKYFLGPMIAYLGSLKLSGRDRDIRKVAFPIMEGLRDSFNETVSLYVAEGDQRTCVERVETTHDLRRVVHVGERLPMDRGATGRLLLAFMDEEKAMAIIKDKRHVDLKTLKEAREKGYTFSNGEREEGVAAIAAPVYDNSGQVVAALSMSGPSFRFINGGLELKISAVVTCAKEISLELGYFKEMAKERSKFGPVMR